MFKNYFKITFRNILRHKGFSLINIWGLAIGMAVCILIAIPITYYVMNSWLQSFAYHITIGWWIFPLASLIVSFIAAVSISFQTIKAANSNPVDALKYE